MHNWGHLFTKWFLSGYRWAGRRRHGCVGREGTAVATGTIGGNALGRTPMSRTLFIDADACPVTREALDTARRAGWPVVIAGNSTQNLERRIRRDDPRDPEHARRGFWVGVLDVSVGADSADFAIVARLSAGDVVVTQDIGLASMVLGRGAAAISVRGARISQGNHRYGALRAPRGEEGAPCRRPHPGARGVFFRGPAALPREPHAPPGLKSARRPRFVAIVETGQTEPGRVRVPLA